MESGEQVSTAIKDKAIQRESVLAEWYELEKFFDVLESAKDDDSRQDSRILKGMRNSCFWKGAS